MDYRFASSKCQKTGKLRDFKPADLKQVKSLIDTTIDAVYSHYPGEFIDYWKNNLHSESSILEEARNGFIVVAELDRKIVGAGTLDEKEISRLFVAKSFQRRGIGKLIMSRLEQRAAENGVKVVYLTSTAVSKSFYESLDYKIIEGEVFSNEESSEIGYFRMKKILA